MQRLQRDSRFLERTNFNTSLGNQFFSSLSSNFKISLSGTSHQLRLYPESLRSFRLLDRIFSLSCFLFSFLCSCFPTQKESVYRSVSSSLALSLPGGSSSLSLSLSNSRKPTSGSTDGFLSSDVFSLSLVQHYIDLSRFISLFFQSISLQFILLFSFLSLLPCVWRDGCVFVCWQAK